MAKEFSQQWSADDDASLRDQHPDNRTNHHHDITWKQYGKLFVRSAVPFMGFGLCDNLIMISVGDAIDTNFGVTMGFSTMTAAGLGQAVSDGSGITIQSTIERLADRLGLPDPKLTVSQSKTSRVLFIVQIARTVGIVAGCLCGLIPVMMFDAGNKPRLYEVILQGLPEKNRKELASAATTVHFDQGDKLLVCGQVPSAFFTIVSGQAKVVGRDDEGNPCDLCDANPGDPVGEIEIVTNRPCVADVIAMTPIKALCIKRTSVDSLLTEEAKGIIRDHILSEERYVPFRYRYANMANHLDEKE